MTSASAAAATKAEGARAPGRASGADDEAVVSILTPESVPVRFTIAGMGDRVAAFGIDAAIILVLILGFGLLGGFASTGASLGTAFAILAAFVLRNFYFTWFEIRRQGQTPGKRRLFLRVVDRRGGPLSAEAVFVRNVMREVELFIPIVALFAPQALFPVDAGLGRLFAVSWIFLVAAMPLFNRERLRVGDLVAGTMVVRLPRPSLLADLASSPAAAAASREAGATYVFTAEQLDVYGIYELQVLEGLLREGPSENRSAALETVGRKIRKKIGYAAPESAPVSELEFLRDFYAAQRARLEGKMLLGTRRERKAR